jgi:hypothetical protein
MSQNDTNDTVDTEPFLHALHRALRPEVLVQAGDELADLVEAVTELRKKGRLTMTVELTPHERVPDAVEITCRVKAVPPTPPPVARIMYADGGRLVQEDPRQTRLELGPRLVNPTPEEAAR